MFDADGLGKRGMLNTTAAAAANDTNAEEETNNRVTDGYMTEEGVMLPILVGRKGQ